MTDLTSWDLPSPAPPIKEEPTLSFPQFGKIPDEIRLIILRQCLSDKWEARSWRLGLRLVDKWFEKETRSTFFSAYTLRADDKLDRAVGKWIINDLRTEILATELRKLTIRTQDDLSGLSRQVQILSWLPTLNHIKQHCTALEEINVNFLFNDSDDSSSESSQGFQDIEEYQVEFLEEVAALSMILRPGGRMRFKGVCGNSQTQSRVLFSFAGRTGLAITSGEDASWTVEKPKAPLDFRHIELDGPVQLSDQLKEMLWESQTSLVLMGPQPAPLSPDSYTKSIRRLISSDWMEDLWSTATACAALVRAYIEAAAAHNGSYTCATRVRMCKMLESLIKRLYQALCNSGFINLKLRERDVSLMTFGADLEVH